MKWLTGTFLCLFAFSTFAEESIRQAPNPDSVIKHFTLTMGCGPIPADEMLAQKYSEIPFVQGPGTVHINPTTPINGNIKMFVNPEDKTYTIMFEVGNELFCMLGSGNSLGPVVSGTKL